MAIYKPSNLGPNLEEIDVDLRSPKTEEEAETLGNDWQANIFEAQVNTTGENVLAYRLNILENNTEEVIYESDGIDLPKKESNLYGKPGVKNKDFVKTYFFKDDIYTSSDNFIVSTERCPALRNGKDYQWNIRMYDAPLSNPNQPITKVCDGFLVGTTSYVIWGIYDKDANDQILYDRYVEFKPTYENVYPIIGKNENDVEYPPSSEKVERVQIDWVEKDLGTNKNYTKIELVEGLEYNYKDEATFQIFLCSNQHTLNSAFADPNSTITSSMFMARYGSRPSNVKNNFSNLEDLGIENPASNTTGFKDVRRIIGVSGNTGEIRVQEPFISVPTNDDYYVLYEYNRVEKKYRLVEGQVPNPQEITAESGILIEDVSSTCQIAKQKIGGFPVTYGSAKNDTFKVVSNKWNGKDKRLFIQPNINIKTDATNPNELVFDVNGVRVDIIRQLSESNNKDITFNKLDNTQWLLENEALEAVTSTGETANNVTEYNEIPSPTSSNVSIIPGSIYTVYTDFMDSTPNGVFYARKTPTITMQYHNMNDNQEYIDITDEMSQPWRDIEFKAEWDSPNNTQIKYYKYILYNADGEVIKEGEDTYDTDLYFWFRGFQTDSNEPETIPVNYSVELLVVDELNKEFVETRNFSILYKTERAEAPLEVEYDCEKQAFKITAETPFYAMQSEKGGKEPVSENQLTGDGTVLIPFNKVMNYDTVFTTGRPNIVFTKPLSYLTQFRLTKEFIRLIPQGQESIITEIECQRTENTEDGYDKYTLKLSSSDSFYMDDKGHLVKNDERLRFRWYKNDSIIPLMCFDNGKSNYYSIVDHDPSQKIEFPDKYAYAFQQASTEVSDNEEYNYSGWTSVVFLPDEDISVQYKYLLSQVCIINNVIYYPGIYIWINEQWELVNDTTYLWLDELSQFEGATYDSLSTPSNSHALAADPPGSFRFQYVGNVFVNNFNTAIELGRQALAQKWFVLYFIITEELDENNIPIETQRAYIQINEEKVGN